MGMYSGYEPEADKPDRLPRKGKFSKRIIVGIAVILLVFTAVVIVATLLGAYVPDSLIYCVFGAALGEFWALATVKQKKIMHEGSDTYVAEADSADDQLPSGGGLQE